MQMLMEDGVNKVSSGGLNGSGGNRFGNGNGSGGGGGLPKLREIFRRQKPESEDEESLDIDFVYDDEDSNGAEIAEFYSYTEFPEFALNQSAFHECLQKFDMKDVKGWQTMSESRQRAFILSLSEMLDEVDRNERLKGTRALLYIAQGCWLECQSDDECWINSRKNVILLYECGIFSSVLELLNMEIENTQAAANANRKLAVSLADSVELRSILGILYTMTQVLRTHEDPIYSENFAAELNIAKDEDLLSIRLLTMITRFCSGAAPHFPMKKVLLLLWKVLLTSLGGIDKLKDLKNEYRHKANLPEILEDTITISRTMRAASPPASAADMLESGNNNNNRRGGLNRPGIRRLRNAKQQKIDFGLNLDDGDEDYDGSLGDSPLDSAAEAGLEDPDADVADDAQFGTTGPDRDRSDSPRPGTPMIEREDNTSRKLPWTPKVRLKDLDQFLDYSRVKFVGYTLQDDRTSLAGLPEPIHEGVRVLKEHMYTSLAEKQIEAEEQIACNPISMPEPEVSQTPTETLYQAMLPSLPQYMIALLKILLAAAPTSKAKTESINIMTDVLPEQMPMTVMQSMKLGIDVNRHKEIIVKAVSAILLLLLKHFKVNHIYQFEFMSQHLVFANCIPLVLKFFNQNILAYIGSKNNIALLDFPSCVIGEQPELTAETLEIGDTSPYCWRNMFSCINLLRVLNKLTKWKHSRIMMLVVFKSAPILKRTLKVKHAMLQLYVLKLLKMQTKYLGRQWRKSNMKTMSAIYTKVRHRLNDDWAYGNDVDSRPWDFQAEECALRAAVDRFNNRRYDRSSGSGGSSGGGTSDRSGKDSNAIDIDFEPVDNCISSVLGQEVELTDEFKMNYEKWLVREVFQTEIKWELLLDDVDDEL